MRSRLSLAACASICLLAATAARCQNVDALRAGFESPPDEAKPRTWWHWVSGNISKKGITTDLEAMKRVGVAEAQVFNVDQGPAGPVRTLSPEWNDLTSFAIQEANRIGIELAFENCPGWSTSGGPWVTPEQSMQQVYWSTANVTGGGEVNVVLPPPKDKAKDGYKDIAVLAFPTPRGDASEAATVTASDGVKDAASLLDGDRATEATLAWPAEGQPAYVQFDFAEPVTRGSMSIRFDKYRDRPKGEVQSSDDGKTFKTLARFEGDSTLIFEPATARHFRVVIQRPREKTEGVKLAELSWEGARLANGRAKAAFHADVASKVATPWAIPAEMSIAQDKLIDITSHLAEDGQLKWAAPAGEWTILRIGHASNDTKNHPTVPEATGLEVDKLSAEAVTSHFNNGYMGMVIKDAGPLAGKSLKYVLCDSWEAGSLNWTPKMRETFMAKCGYDPIPWLPAMTGRVVGSVDQSERFLWDLRRLIADLTADNHFGVMQKLAHDHGMQFYAEAPGISMPTVADELQCKARTDIPMGEFWLHGIGSADVKEASSAAHINGKRWVAAESFTSRTEEASWKNDPYSVKALGDKHFALGLNRIVFHRYAHQPDDRVPGVTMGPWGLNFERSQTWWEPGAAWMKYIARCQWLLSQGEQVADVLYFYGEGAPNTLPAREALKPSIPIGYDYDGIDAETLAKATVQDGKIVLPGGASYRVLALAESDSMTPKTLAVVERLANAGATIMGKKPTRSPSLMGYPKVDEQIAKTADKVWDRHGVSEGDAIEHLLAASNVARDFSFIGASSDAIMAVHRRAGTSDIYFVSNQKYRRANVVCSFRVAGKVPELWHADTGVIEPAPVYREQDGITTVPLTLESAESVFVVFRDAAKPADWVVSVGKPGGANAAAAAAPEIEVVKAVYRPIDGSEGVDVTQRVIDALAKPGTSTEINNDSMGGDPKFRVVKELVIDFTLGGKPMQKIIDEGDRLSLADDGLGAPPPKFALRRDAAGALKAIAWEPGDIDLTFASGKTWHRTIDAAATKQTIDGAWDVSFPKDRGAPSSVTLDTLASWTKNADAGVKYFSGTATYTKSFDLDASLLGEGKVIELDLGEVKNLAEVSLNGQPLGILWKPPFRVDISKLAKPGRNELTVKVTNLWPNRLIGDQSLPPEQRVTWTTFNPYKAGAKLLPSGLLGPVTIRSAAAVTVEP